MCRRFPALLVYTQQAQLSGSPAVGQGRARVSEYFEEYISGRMFAACTLLVWANSGTLGAGVRKFVGSKLLVYLTKE